MAEPEEAQRSESGHGEDFGEMPSRRTQKGLGDSIRGLQFSSDDEEGGGRAGPAGRSAEEGAPSPSLPLQARGGLDDELDGAPVIRADDDEEEDEEEDDWNMDTGAAPDGAVAMEADGQAEPISEPQSEGSDSGPALASRDEQHPPVADVEMSAVEECVTERRALETPVLSVSDPSLGGAAVPQCESRGTQGDVPLVMEKGCLFPPIDIKDEPIDEEYDRALLPLPPPKRIKDEPDTSEDLLQQQKTSEELRISSVFSVGGDSTPPSVPAAPPLPSLSGGARASAAPPRVMRTDTPPAPPAHSATPPSVSRAACSGCSKVLQKGQTAFQRKGSSQLYCSTVCLTGCTLPPAPKPPAPRKTCHYCLKEIPNPKDVIIAPVDGSGTVKDFCSQVCLSSLSGKRTSAKPPPDPAIKCSVCKKTAVINHEVNYQGTVHQLCSDSCFSRFRSCNNLTMNCCETCGSYCYSSPGQCHLLQIEGTTRKFCSQACLTAYKQKTGRVIPCAGCQALRTVVEMVEGPGPEGKIQLYCTAACASANGPASTSIAGASFPCTTCRLLAVPQFHLALNDGTIRNFCSYTCVVSFQASLNKSLPPGQVNGSSAPPESLSAPPSGLPLPPQGSAPLPPLSAPRHDQAPPHGLAPPLGPVPAPPLPATHGHGPALPASLPRGPAPAQAPPSLGAGPAPLSHSVVKLCCRQCRRLFSSKPELLLFKGQMVVFCGRPCSQSYRKVNFVNARCEYCKLDKVVKDFIKFNHVERPFCSEGCKLLFKHDLAKRTGKPCRTCTYCTGTAQNMILNHFGGKLEEFCREECMALYTVLYYQMAKCDWCQRQGKLEESQKWLGEMKHFCNLSCLLLFSHQQTSTYDQLQRGQSSACDQLQRGQSSACDQLQRGQSSACDQLQRGQSSPHEQPQWSQSGPYDLQPQPNPSVSQEQQRSLTSGAVALPAHIPTGAAPTGMAPPPPLPIYASKEATPVIANVVSLASAPSARPYVTANTALQGAVPATLIQTKINGDASTQTDAMRPPAAPRRVLKNKALLCKPISQNKGTLCRPHQQTAQSQTDEVNGQKILLLPVPVPVFIPVPMHLYAQYTPVPVGLPVPVPVPLFVPPPVDQPESKVGPSERTRPSAPQAEEEEEEEPDRPVSYGDQGSTYGGDLESEGVSTPLSWEEEPAASAQRLGATDFSATSTTPPPMDLEADFPLAYLDPEYGKDLGATPQHRGRPLRPQDGFPPRKRVRPASPEPRDIQFSAEPGPRDFPFASKPELRTPPHQAPRNFPHPEPRHLPFTSNPESQNISHPEPRHLPFTSNTESRNISHPEPRNLPFASNTESRTISHPEPRHLPFTSNPESRNISHPESRSLPFTSNTESRNFLHPESRSLPFASKLESRNVSLPESRGFPHSQLRNVPHHDPRNFYHESRSLPFASQPDSRSFPHPPPRSFPHPEPRSLSFASSPESRNFPHAGARSFPHPDSRNFPHPDPRNFPHPDRRNLPFPSNRDPRNFPHLPNPDGF